MLDLSLYLPEHYSGGQGKAGVDEGPIKLVEAGLLDDLKGLGWSVDFGGHHQFETIEAADDPPIGKLLKPRLVSKVCEAVAKTVGDHAKRGSLPVTLGGDHSLVRSSLISRSHLLTSLFRQWERFLEP